MTFQEFVNTVARRVWGFLPFRQVKPVHFANGFFGSIAGRQADISLLRQAGAGFRSGRTKVTTPEFIEAISERYRYESGGTLPLDKAEDLRTVIDLVLNQDEAFFAGDNFSTATLTHVEHISSDPSDAGTGEFLARVLLAFQDSQLVGNLLASIQNDSDDIFALTLPLLGKNAPAPRDVQLESGGGDIEERLRESRALQSVCRAFSIASSYRSILEKTLFLQRIVTLGCFGLYLYLINRFNEMEQRESKVPILLASPNVSPEVREASRATHIRARQQIVQAFEFGLKAEMRNRGEDSLDPDGYRQFVNRLLGNPSSKTQETSYRRAKEWFATEYSDNLIASEDPFQAFVIVFTQMTFLHDRTSPANVAQYLGRLLGLIYPREGGRGLRYYRPTPSFLDTLSVALLRPGEEITAEEFWERAWNEFGIISGYRSSFDAEYLGQWGVRQASVLQLRENSYQIMQELKRMGLAEEYADDVSMIRVNV